MRKLHLVLFCAVVVGAGTVLRLLDLAGVGPLPDLPGIAAVIVPLLGLIELRRVLRTLVRRRPPPAAPPRLPLRGRRRGRLLLGADGHVAGRLVDASAAGVGLVARRAARRSAHARRSCSSSTTPPARRHEVAAQVEVRCCREADGRYLVGATIIEIDSDVPHAADGVVLRRLQPRAPARPPPGGADSRRRGDRAAAAALRNRFAQTAVA